MELFGGVIPIKEISFLLFCLFGILFAGYALGRITIKGVSLGDAGVFIAALVFGAFLFGPLSEQLTIVTKAADGTDVPVEYIKKALKVIESLGLILFVTSVGFIAGPKFFANMKKNFKNYVVLGLVVIIAGGLAAVACIFMGDGIGYGSGAENRQEFVAMIVGLLSGSLTSTPAFSAAKQTVAEVATTEQVAERLEDIVSVGHGISYIFGVIGVVLFVQLIPKIMKANMEKERALIAIAPTKKEETKKVAKLLHLDHMGIAAFSLAAVLGTFFGAIKVPLSGNGLSGTCFSLTTTGGCLLVALIIGHFGKAGRISLMPAETTLKLFRELGLVLFLAGAGIAGGAEFVNCFDPMYFVYGMIMTIVPMIIGFLFAKYVLKLSLLNNLGSLTGGMTSTPALGTLIGTAGTEDVAAAYAATYPIALIAVVLVSQFLIILF